MYSDDYTVSEQKIKKIKFSTENEKTDSMRINCAIIRNYIPIIHYIHNDYIRISIVASIFIIILHMTRYMERIENLTFL